MADVPVMLAGERDRGIEVAQACVYLLHLPGEPYVFSTKGPAAVCRLPFPVVGGVIEDVEEHSAVAQRQAAIEELPRRVHGRSDEIPLEEIVNGAMGVATDHGISLEDEDMLRWGQLLPQPWPREIDVDADARGYVELIGDGAHVDGAGLNGTLPDGGVPCSFYKTIACLFGGVKDNGPFGAENGVEMQDKRHQLGGVLGVGDHSYFVFDSYLFGVGRRVGIELEPFHLGIRISS